MAQQAIGLLETRGLTPLVVGTDAMLKAAEVTLVGPMRQVGNAFEKVLPVFAAYRVGWFNQGLVSGKTHRPIQETRYRAEKNPAVWQQDVRYCIMRERMLSRAEPAHP